MIDEHEACYREMQRIDQEWRDRLDNRCTVKQVIREGDVGTLKVEQILEVIHGDDGLTVRIR